MEVHHHVDFLADVGARFARRIATDCVPASAVEGIFIGCEPEAMVLHPGGEPFRRIDVHVQIEILDVLPPDLVGPSEVIVAEWKQLIERIRPSGVRGILPTGVIVVCPKSRSHRDIFETITHPGRGHPGHDGLTVQ